MDGKRNDTEVIVIEEDDIPDTHLPNGREVYSVGTERNYRNDATRRNDFEMNKVKIKEEVDLSHEDITFSTGFGNTFNSKSVACDNNNTEFRESNISIKKEGNCFTSDLVKKVKKELFMYNENDEVSVTRTATEIGSQVEASVSNFFRQNKNRDKKPEASESFRLPIDATPGGEIMETSQMSENVNSLRSTELESGKSCESALYSERQVGSSDSGLQQNSSMRSFNFLSRDKMVYKCDICHNSFTLLSDLKAHILSHEDKKQYECSVCKKVFTKLPYLKTHTMRHEGKKPYACDVCKKDFFLLTDLKRHEMIHWDKPYKCNVCKEICTVLSDFRAHIRLHEGKKALECKICKKSFIWASHLKIHILTHKAKKPHECTVCKETFTHISSLRAHNLMHERQQQEELWAPINS